MANSKSTSDTKYRNFQFVSYVDPSCYVELFQTAVHYAWICHDSPDDLATEDGTEKQKHFHLVVAFKNPRYPSALFKKVLAWSEEHGSTLRVEPCADLRSSLLYLTHENTKSKELGKFVYPLTSLSCDDMSWYNTIIDSGELGSFSMTHFLRDLITLNPIELAINYGRDFIKNSRKYLDFGADIVSFFGGDVSSALDYLDANTSKIEMLQLPSDTVLGGDVQ